MGKNQRGFSIIELVLGLVAAGLLVGIGFYVYQATNNTDNTLTNTEESSSSSIKSNDKSSSAKTKEYKSTEFGFKVDYPSDWSIKEDISDKGRGGREGTVKFTSSDGFVLTLAPNFGGRGGACEPGADDKPHAAGNACATNEVLYKEKVTKFTKDTVTYDGQKLTDIYLVRYRFTNIDGKSEYLIGLDDDDASGEDIIPIEVNKPSMGLWVPYTVLSLKKTTLDISIDGTDTSSKDVFNNASVKKSEDILKSFRLF